MTPGGRAVVATAVLAALAAFAACVDLGDRIVVERPSSGLVFDRDIQPIFDAHCAFSGCHAPPVQQGLDLRSGVAYDHIVGVASSEMSALLRIHPGEPDSSYLVRKVSACSGCYVGSRMPLNRSPLTSAQIQALRDWTAAGAGR